MTLDNGQVDITGGTRGLGAAGDCMASGTGLHSGKLTRPGCSVSNFLKIGLI